MAGSMSKAISRARHSLDKAVAKQQRKHALAKAMPALKTAGKATAIVAVLAGAAYAVNAASKKHTATKKVAAKKKRAIVAAATAATAVGATAIAARVRRGKQER